MKWFSFHIGSLLVPFLIIGLLTACEVEEEPSVVAVESVSLGTDRLLMAEGESTMLEVSILPENATDKGILWETSDASVVTVSADGVLEALAQGEAVVTATTRDGGFSASCTVEVVWQLPQDDSRDGRTVLVYIAGDNNLSSFAKEDVEEMKKGMASVVSSTMHLLVYVDYGKGDARLMEISNRDGMAIEQTIKEYGDRNSTGISETLEVFGDVFANPDYQAESYGLVYWSHCDGWIPYPVPSASTRWIGQDTGEGDKRMNLSDFVQILHYAPHFDFIMFDACFMQSIEVAYALREYTDYYIASPTETPGPGAPYDRMVPYMFMKGAAVEMAKVYFETYSEKYKEGNDLSNTNWTAGASICVLKTEGLDNLAALTRQALPQTSVDVADLRKRVYNYDRRRPSIGYYDMQEMMYDLLVEKEGLEVSKEELGESETAFEQWKQGFDEAVVYWETTPLNYSSSVGLFSMEGTHGVSHYIPASVTSEAAEAYRSTDWYEAAGLSRLGW